MVNYQQKHEYTMGSPYLLNMPLEGTMFKFSTLNCMLCFT